MQDNEQILYKAIGKVIKSLRVAKGHKFTIFCYENDIPKSTLYDIENGKIKAQFSSVYKIVKTIGVDFPVFVSLLEKELPQNFTLTKE